LAATAWADDTTVSVVDRPASAPGNVHYVGNRSPLQPSLLIKLPVGSIEPRGWLRKNLRLQADGFHGHLTEISGFLKKEGNAWLSKSSQGDHGWEEPPYWLKGYGNCAYVLGDERMIAESKVWIEAAIRSQKVDGWFGPDKDRTGVATNVKGRNDLWPNMIMCFCLQNYYSYTSDKRVIDLMTRYFKYLNEKVPADKLLNGFWAVSRGGDLLSSVYWLYNHTGDPWLLDLAKKVHADTARWDKGIANWHNVNIAQGFGEPGTYWLQSGDPNDLQAAYRNFHKVRELYGQVPGGMFGADENARPGHTGPRQAIETCGIVEQMFSDETLLIIDGDLMWADHCENVAFNSLPAAVLADMKALRYLTAPNQVLSDAKSKSPGIQNRGPMFLMSPHLHRCCQHNWGQGWPYYAEHLWLATPGNGLAAVMYSASKVTAKVGPGKGTKVAITEETKYPFGETATFTLDAPAVVRFPLYLRIPAWCEAATVAINGKAVPAESKPGKYLVIDRSWSSGDKLTLTLPMRVRVKRWASNHGFASVDRGPLTYSLQIGEKYVRHGGTEQWPNWEIHPTTPWNYGLVLNGDNPAASLKLTTRDYPQSDMPFTQEGVPVMLTAKAKRIPNWTLDAHGLIGQMQGSPVLSDQPTETVTLIPMGAARLRISAIPVIGTGPDARPWPAQPHGTAGK